jgi:hypothetical protein
MLGDGILEVKESLSSEGSKNDVAGVEWEMGESKLSPKKEKEEGAEVDKGIGISSGSGGLGTSNLRVEFGAETEGAGIARE